MDNTIKLVKCLFCGNSRDKVISQIANPKHTAVTASIGNATITITPPNLVGICNDCAMAFSTVITLRSNISHIPLKDGTVLNFDQSDPEDPRWYRIRGEKKEELYRHEIDPILRDNNLLAGISQHVWQDACSPDKPLKHN